MSNQSSIARDSDDYRSSRDERDCGDDTSVNAFVCVASFLISF